jgi:hypothetical protein
MSAYLRHAEMPIARRSDSLSSHLAARNVTESGKRQSHLEQIIDAVRRRPGCTAGELAQFTKLSHVQIDRRTGDLRLSGRVTFGEIRTCRVFGRQMQTLWPATERNA